MLVHVAIVSDQLLPTVIPCLMHRPDRVVLVASRPMAAKAERLRRVLEQHGLTAVIYGQAPDAGLADIRTYAAKLAEELTGRSPGDEWVFNATGGNKLMTLGFVEVFRERADRIIYTDTAHGQIEVIADRHTTAPQPEQMRDVLDVPHYLAVQGFRYYGSVSDDAGQVARIQARRELAAKLAQEAGRQSGLIGMLNALAHGAMDEQGRHLVHPVQRLSKALNGAWRALFAQFAQAGLLKVEGDRTVRFSDLESTRFLGGGWLEEYALAVAQEAELFDVRMGVKGVWEGTESARNEFDVLACHRNRMLFIECKTLRFTGHENDNDLAYKVKSLGEDTRGLLGDTWVLAAQGPSPILCDRAKQAGFQVIRPKHLSTLRGWLDLWKQGQS
ncbi:MAG TPA: DUF1887 family CARF protein [Nitrospiraceae bacterium]|jgi:hypothetical protein|nr:DUF1887 family CARF protein [Nitrospiraceae bacterium]